MNEITQEISRRTLGKGFVGVSLIATMAALSACSEGNGPEPGGGATSGGNGGDGETDGNGGGDGGNAGAGGILNYAIAGEAMLNPAKATSAEAQQAICQAIFDTLLRFNPDGSITPGLAESYEMAEDKKSMTLTLRPDLKFTDGSPLDAEAVKYYINYHKEAGGSDASRSEPITVDVQDELTLLMTTDQPYPLLPMFLCLSVGSVCAKAQIDSENADVNPIGAGPYMFDESRSTSGSVYHVVRNPDYHAPEDFGFDEVIFRQMDDVTARLNALQTGQVNAGILNTQSVAAVEAAGLNVVRMMTNWSGLFIADRLGETVPALGDVRVRRAMNMVWDREAILQAVENGEGAPTNQIFLEGNEAHRADLAGMYPFDIDGARALMNEAGYADGFDLVIPSLEGFSTNNPLVVSQLGEIGIRVTQETLSGFNGFLSMLQGEFAVFWFALETRNALWDVVQGVTPDAIWNVKKQTTPEVEELCTQLLSASDAEFDDIAQELGGYLLEEAWFAPVYSANSVFVIDDTVTAEATIGSSHPYFPTFQPAN